MRRRLEARARWRSRGRESVDWCRARAARCSERVRGSLTTVRAGGGLPKPSSIMRSAQHAAHLYVWVERIPGGNPGEPGGNKPGTKLWAARAGRTSCPPSTLAGLQEMADLGGRFIRPVVPVDRDLDKKQSARRCPQLEALRLSRLLGRRLLPRKQHLALCRARRSPNASCCLVFSCLPRAGPPHGTVAYAWSEQRGARARGGWSLLSELLYPR